MSDILVGTKDGLHKTGSADVRLEGRDVGSLARGADGWWAVVDGHEVWRSKADGPWESVAALDGPRANCVLQTDVALFVGAAESRLFREDGGALQSVDSFDGTAGRDTWHTPWGGPPDVRSMSADPKGDLYVNVHVGGIPRSRDGGETWQPTIEVNADVHQVLFAPGSGRLLAACAPGLAVSDDSGETWRYEAEGVHGRYMRAVAVTGDTVLVTASTGPYTDRAAVYRKPVGDGGAFEKCAAGLPEWFSDNVDTYCLAADESVAAFGTSDGVVYVSEDGGLTWDIAAEGLPGIRCLALG